MSKITKTKGPVGVEMVDNDAPATRTYEYEFDGLARLGKEIKISPKSFATINKPGYKTEFFVETVSVTIGIGKDHVADLIMSKEAWEALNSGEEVSITTLKEFQKKYVHTKKS